MCGIFGVFAASGALPDEAAAAAALAQLAHRGPDARGLWRDAAAGVCLGHTRLSILDLDPRSDQPFHGDRCTVAFNGEIYNFRRLRDELIAAGAVFRTTSDTEVVAHGFRHWGTGVFERLLGMFAIALYDAAEGVLHVARDEFGIKPLCLLQRDNAVWLASEAKAIPAGRERGLDDGVLADLLRWGFAWQDRSLYADVEFLPPGTRRSYRRTAAGGLAVTAATFARAGAAWRGAAAGGDAAVAGVRTAVASAVQEHLVADVPVSLALSGGLDSSVVAAAAAPHATGLHAHTFTLVGSGDAEIEHAALLCRELGLQHRAARLGAADVAGWLRRVAWHLEEPVANPNALPGFALGALVRAAGDRVVLVGEGADEVFGGYPWYRFALPAGAGADPAAVFAAYAARRAMPMAPPWLRAGLRARLLARHEEQQRAFVAELAARPAAPWQGFLAIDLATQLQYSQLLRVDRMFMAHGVEARTPFLYRPVLAAAAGLAAAQLFGEASRGERSEKLALAAAFADRLPAAIRTRPKFGARGTVDLWQTPLAAGLATAFARALHGAELREARQLLDDRIDWAAVAAAPLAPKQQFALTMLLECVDAQLLHPANRGPADPVPVELLP